jgi:arylsulfatase A-like enzyme
LNVVVLVIDDVRWDSLGAAGNRIVRTPRIDRLAKGTSARSTEHAARSTPVVL